MMSKKIPKRSGSTGIDYAAEIALYAKLIKEGGKFTQPEFCEARKISYHAFRRRVNDFRKAGNAPIEKQPPGRKESDSGNSKKTRKKAPVAQKKPVSPAQKDAQANARSIPPEQPKNKEIIERKYSEDAQSPAQKECPNDEFETDWESFPAFQEATIHNFDIFAENKKLLKSCVEVLSVMVTKIKAGAVAIQKVSDVKAVTGAIRDVQVTLEKLTPDYSRVGMQQEIGNIFEKLMKEEIDVVEAALTIERTGMPLPDSIKILLSKSEPVEKEPEYVAISEEEILERRHANLLKLQAEQSGQGARIYEIQKLKEELRTTSSFDVEADEKEA